MQSIQRLLICNGFLHGLGHGLMVVSYQGARRARDGPASFGTGHNPDPAAGGLALSVFCTLLQLNSTKQITHKR